MDSAPPQPLNAKELEYVRYQLLPLVSQGLDLDTISKSDMALLQRYQTLNFESESESEFENYEGRDGNGHDVWSDQSSLPSDKLEVASSVNVRNFARTEHLWQAFEREMREEKRQQQLRQKKNATFFGPFSAAIRPGQSAQSPATSVIMPPPQAAAAATAPRLPGSFDNLSLSSRSLALTPPLRSRQDNVPVAADPFMFRNRDFEMSTNNKMNMNMNTNKNPLRRFNVPRPRHSNFSEPEWRQLCEQLESLLQQEEAALQNLRDVQSALREIGFTMALRGVRIPSCSVERDGDSDLKKSAREAENELALLSLKPATQPMETNKNRKNVNSRRGGQKPSPSHVQSSQSGGGGGDAVTKRGAETGEQRRAKW